MENAKNRVNIIILDACRDNPFIRSSRSGSRGLAAIDAPGGTIISYSTAPGSIAEDGAGENSTFTKYLLSNIGLPGLRIEDVFKNVRKKVMEETKNRQIPWESSSLVGDFYFSYPISITSADKPTQPLTSEQNLTLKQEMETSLEITFWKSIEKSTNSEDFKDYLQRFPHGNFAGIAKRKVDALEAERNRLAKEQEENAWINWQTKFQDNVSKIKKIDMDNNISAQSKQNEWEKLLRDYSQDNPNSIEDEELRTYANERIKHWKNEIKRLSTVSQQVTKPSVKPSTFNFPQLRSSYKKLKVDDVKSMLSRKGFFDNYKNKSGSFNNNYQLRTINGDKVVIDRATGLMWHQSGSSDRMKYENAELWINDLNSNGYAGYHDWRLPTLEEGASLLESSKKNGYLYIDPIFSNKQQWMWTGDTFGSGAAWVVNFYDGNVFPDNHFVIPVRPVRSAQSTITKLQSLRQSHSMFSGTRLRSSYMTLSIDDVKAMLNRKGFFERTWNKSGSFNNNYQSRTINGDKIVIDRATGLMWHQSGSAKWMSYEKAEQWIRDFNRRGYAGFNDWRLPTLEEGASLLENNQQNGHLYIDSVFSDKQEWIWTGDKMSSGAGWVVLFYNGTVVDSPAIGPNNIYVRPVRSGQ
jgi:hypothetical protein